MSEIYLRIGKSNVIECIHRAPFDPTNGLQMTRDELEKTGVFVNVVPDAEMREGYRAVAKYNPDTKSVYYDYVSVPLSNSERLEQLEEAFNEFIGSLGDLF